MFCLHTLFFQLQILRVIGMATSNYPAQAPAGNSTHKEEKHALETSL